MGRVLHPDSSSGFLFGILLWDSSSEFFFGILHVNSWILPNSRGFTTSLQDNVLSGLG
jgi:hypothetical protein